MGSTTFDGYPAQSASGAIIDFSLRGSNGRVTMWPDPGH